MTGCGAGYRFQGYGPIEGSKASMLVDRKSEQVYVGELLVSGNHWPSEECLISEIDGVRPEMM